MAGTARRAAAAAEGGRLDTIDLADNPSMQETAAGPAAEPSPGGRSGEATPAIAGLGARAARNTLVVLIARIASRVVALVAVLAAANHLGEAGFGRFQTVVTYGALVGTVLDLGYSTLLVREGARERDQLERYLDNVLSLKLLLSVAGFGVLAGVLRLPGLDDLLLPGFAVMTTAAYSNLLRVPFYAVGRLGFEAADIVLESAVVLGLTLWGIHSGAGPGFFLWAYAASYAVSCAWFAICLTVTGTARLRWRFEVSLLRAWFRAGIPLAVTYILATVYFKVDVPILQHARGDAEAGVYTNAYKPFEALLFIPITLRQVLFPVMSIYFRASSDRLQLGAEKLWRALLLTGWPCTVGLVILAPNLAGLIHLFPDAAAPLRILGAGVVVMFVDNTFIAALNAMDRQGLYARIALAGLAVNLLLDVTLIPAFGHDGAAWATVATEVVLVTLGGIMLARAGCRLRLARLSWRILLAGAAMGGVLLPFSGQTRGIGTIGVVLLGVGCYGLALALLRAFDREELLLAVRVARGLRRSG